MLNSASPLSQSSLHSALQGQSRLRPQGGRFRRSTVTSLMLTSLVDAFSILVIFLIMNTATSQNVVDTGKLQLPQAAQSGIMDMGVVVRIENGQFLVEDKPTAISQLGSQLKSLHESVPSEKKEGLIIVADKDLDYEALSPVILAGSQAGFTKFKFAVVRKD